MKTIKIDSKRYPCEIMVSDEDHEAVAYQVWYPARSKQGGVKIDAFIGGRKVSLKKFIYSRMHSISGRRIELVHLNKNEYDFTRENIHKVTYLDTMANMAQKEARIVQRLLERDSKKESGNEFCAGLEANMLLRKDW